jgi:hypothetical protein
LRWRGGSVVHAEVRSILNVVEPLLRWLAAAAAVGQAIWTLYKFLSVHILDFPVPSIADVGRGALFVHALTVLFLIGAPALLPNLQERPEFRNAIIASRQFVLFWFFVWVGFFALYATWCYYWPEISTGTEGLAVHLAIDFFNLVTGALMFLCYLVMVLRSVPPPQFGWYRVIFWVFVSVILFVVAEGLTAKYFPDAPGTFGKQGYFDAVQGLLSGIAIALLVGRLESRLIDSPRWLVAALYGYAVLQFAYPVLTQNNPEKALTFLFITSLALLLKVLLFWEFRRIVVSGRLTYYMIEYRRQYDAGSTDRDRVMKDLLPPD